MNGFLPLLVLCGVAAAQTEVAGPAGSKEEAARLLERALAAMGGEAAVAGIRTQSRKGVGRFGDDSFTFETLSKAPAKWLLTVTASGRTETQAFDGAAGWSERAGVIGDLDARERANQDAFLDHDLLVRIKRHGAAVARDGAVEAQIEGRKRILRFDAVSGLLKSIDGVTFDDYREAGGVRLPHQAAVAAWNLAMTFEEIRNNVPVDDAVFRRPAPGPAFLKSFEGLGEGPAVEMLRRAFGQGVTPSDGRLLYDLIVARGYKRALDVGTARGYSSLWFALAMQKTGGQVVTIEIDRERTERARTNFRDAGLDGRIDSRINDALIEIPRLAGEFDFVFFDTGAPLNKRLLDLLDGRIRTGGAIAAHNAGEFEKHQPDYLKAIQTDPRFETRIVPTASGGIAITTVRE